MRNGKIRAMRDATTKVSMLALVLFTLSSAPAHAFGTFFAGSWNAPIFVSQPVFASASFRAPGPVIVQQPAFAAISFLVPQSLIASQPSSVAVAVNRPALAVQDTPISLNAEVRNTAPVVESEPVGINIAVNRPDFAAQPAQMPGIRFGTGIRPNFASSSVFALPRISIPTRTLPEGFVNADPIRLPTLEERFPVECGCDGNA